MCRVGIVQLLCFVKILARRSQRHGNCLLRRELALFLRHLGEQVEHAKLNKESNEDGEQDTDHHDLADVGVGLFALVQVHRRL